MHVNALVDIYLDLPRGAKNGDPQVMGWIVN